MHSAASLRVQRFRSIKELKSWSARIGNAYNRAFVNNWEYYPLTEREVDSIVKTLETVADPALIKIIVHGEDVVGFVLAFPDVRRAIQRSKGRLLPFGLIDILLEMRRTKRVAMQLGRHPARVPGPRRQRAALRGNGEDHHAREDFLHAALYQVAETAVDMRRDLATVGGIAYKNHRVYVRKI